MKSKLKILLLAGNTLRARAYAQYLAINIQKDVTVKGLFYGFENKKCSPPSLNSETRSYFINQNLTIPDLNKPIGEVFIENKWDYLEINNSDVNSDEVLAGIDFSDCQIIVFAGYGGQILKQKHFESERKYLHMHPGELPVERGSTTIYYSILNKKACSVTSFFMTKEIDEGENIIITTYPIPGKGVDIDQWFDNVIRADCFIKTIQQQLIGDRRPRKKSNQKESEVYYVIHPVLKHVALLSLK